MTHTPGPWHSSKDGDTVYGPSHRHAQSAELGVEMQFEPVICFVRGYHGSEEAEANARLIAAAPELLNALKLLYAEIEDEHMDCMRQAKAAIGKAEGL